MLSNARTLLLRVMSITLLCLPLGSKVYAQAGVGEGLFLLAIVPRMLISDWEESTKARMQRTVELGASVSFLDFTATGDVGFQMENGWLLTTHYAQIKPSGYKMGEMNGDRYELGFKYYVLGILYFETGLYSSRYRMLGLNSRDAPYDFRDEDSIRSGLYASEGGVGRLGLSIARGYGYFHITLAGFKTLRNKQISFDSNYLSLPESIVEQETKLAESAYQRRIELMFALGLML